MKKIISCVLCFSFLFSLASCGDAIEKIQNEKLIAVEYFSANEKAAEDYLKKDFTKVTYNSSSDVVLAIENGKADFGILDEFQLNSYLSAQRKIKKTELCEYQINYCAYFSSDNEKLKKAFNKAISDLKENSVLTEIIDAHLSEEKYNQSEAVDENGTLTMLCDPNFANRVYTDSKGNIVGLDVDIAREICNYMGYDLEIVSADFDELFSKLQAGEGDFVITASEVTEEREEYFLSSDTYFALNYYLIEKE